MSTIQLTQEQKVRQRYAWFQEARQLQDKIFEKYQQ
jgi:hypothetical protein